MQNKIWKRIENNPNLVAFCNNILNYNSILENETSRNIFFVSLISDDVLINEESCKETIEIADFILKNITLFLLENDVKESVIKYCQDAKNIANRDLKMFKKRKKVV